MIVRVSRIDAGEGPANDEAKTRLPPVPHGCFLQWLFIRDWNRFIHVCGHKAEYIEAHAKP